MPVEIYFRVYIFRCQHSSDLTLQAPIISFLITDVSELGYVIVLSFFIQYRETYSFLLQCTLGDIIHILRYVVFNMRTNSSHLFAKQWELWLVSLQPFETYVLNQKKRPSDSWIVVV